jgi:hypothetical protein
MTLPGAKPYCSGVVVTRMRAPQIPGEVMTVVARTSLREGQRPLLRVRPAYGDGAADVPPGMY